MNNIDVYIIFLNDGVIKGYTDEEIAKKKVEELRKSIPKDQHGLPKGCHCYRYEKLSVEVSK